MHLSFFRRNARKNSKIDVPTGQSCVEEEVAFLDNRTAKSRIIM